MDPDRNAILAGVDKHLEELTGGNTEYLKWIPPHAFPLAGVIVRCGEEIERLGRIMPLASLRALADLYLSLHAYAFQLWRDRSEVEFILRPVIGSKN